MQGISGFLAKPRGPQGARRGRGRAGVGSATPEEEVREVIIERPSQQRFLISCKSKQGHVPKNTIFRSTK